MKYFQHHIFNKCPKCGGEIDIVSQKPIIEYFHGDFVAYDLASCKDCKQIIKRCYNLAPFFVED